MCQIWLNFNKNIFIHPEAFTAKISLNKMLEAANMNFDCSYFDRLSFFLNKHAAFSYFFALNFPFQLLHLCNFIVAPQLSSDYSFSAVRICFT